MIKKSKRDDFTKKEFDAKMHRTTTLMVYGELAQPVNKDGSVNEHTLPQYLAQTQEFTQADNYGKL